MIKTGSRSDLAQRPKVTHCVPKQPLRKQCKDLLLISQPRRQNRNKKYSTQKKIEEVNKEQMGQITDAIANWKTEASKRHDAGLKLSHQESGSVSMV